MGQGHLPVLNPFPVPKGSELYEAKREALWAEFGNRVPKEYHIPQHILDAKHRSVIDTPRSLQILTPQEIEITETHDATSLANAIAERKYTAVAVAQAFVKRAVICHQLTCCLTQWFPEKALAQAQALDDHLARTGKTVGPLHGVPISIKEHIPIEDLPTNFGLIAATFPASRDSLVVALLRRLGAVFYVKTHSPQCLLHVESDSWWGRTLNPHNINLSSGGSSGGEAALLAMRGSILGIGSDIGGSIRVPAGNCGLYGFKATAGTFPARDTNGPGSAVELNLDGVVGPLAHSLRDIDLIMRLVSEQKPWLKDSALVPIPWTGLSTQLTSEPLKVGIMMSNGILTPQPPVTRALEYAYERLSTSPSIEVKPFVMEGKLLTMLTSLYRLDDWFMPDAGATIKNILSRSGEPIHPLTQLLFDWVGDKPPKTIDEIVALRMTRNRFRDAFAESWTKQDVDVVICPVAQSPAPAHDTGIFVDYTALWNLLDYPGLVVPTPIRARKRGEEDYSSTEMLSEFDTQAKQIWQGTDYEGAPIGLQIVARKHHDNFLFGALNVMKESLGLM